MSERRTTIPPQKRIQRIQLEPYDDVVSVRDRLQFVNAARVLLVFPSKGNILQRKLDLVLIQREAARRGLRLAIVVDDPSVAEHAEELNISAFYTVEQARTSRWRRPVNQVFDPNPYRRDEIYELQQHATRLKPMPSRTQLTRQRMVGGVLFGMALLAVLLGIYATVPSATITITPARDQLNVNIPMIADPNIERALPEQLRVPAQTRRFTIDATVTIETTGRRNAENSLAEGVVTFSNSTGLATFIPAGTVVETDSNDPVRFETLNDIALAARQGATADVRVRAVESSSGVEGNVPANTIVSVQGSLGESVTVNNFNPTYGGGIREAAFVTEADRERLQTLVRQQLKQNARDFLLLSLDEGNNFLVPDTIEIVEERTMIYSAEVNEPVDSISLAMQSIMEAIVIDLNAARLVAFANLGNYIDAGRVINERSLTFRRGENIQILEDRRIAFQLRVEGSSLVDIDEQDVQALVAGESARDAQALLEDHYVLDPRRPPVIETFPGFLNRLPLVPSRITVEIEP